MSFFDIVLIIIIAGFGLFGFWFGIVHTIGSLVGTVAGAFIASRFYEPLAGWLMGVTGWGENVSKVVMFIVIFIVINRLVGFGFWLADRVFSIVTDLPFIRSLNRLLGLLFGVFEGMLTIGLAIYFIERFPLSEPFMQRVAESMIAPICSTMAYVLVPLLPQAIQMLKSTVDYVKNIIV